MEVFDGITDGRLELKCGSTDCGNVRSPLSPIAGSRSPFDPDIVRSGTVLHSGSRTPQTLLYSESLLSHQVAG